MDIIFLKPVLKETIWGGDRLKEYGYELPSDHVGECWAISGHENGDCIIENGDYKGESLSWLFNNHRELFDNIDGDVFPLLTKIIDAKEDLSIQVHPDNEYAAKNENGALGKTECWYVLDAEEGNTIVIGHHAKTREEMKKMINEKRWSDFIREIPVKKGDFFQIEPGTLHAIKGGTLILETQQNSDITYRVYDYDRLNNNKPRELHLQKSMDVIKVPFCERYVNGSAKYSDKYTTLEESKEYTDYDNCTVNNSFKLLVRCPYYKVWHADFKKDSRVRQDQHFMLASVIEGQGSITAGDNASKAYKLRKGSNFIIPKGVMDVKFHGDMEVIFSAV